jgi:hypothetical protein
MLCVGIGTSAFCSESLDLGGVGGESFDVIACWLVEVTFKPPNTEGRGAVLFFASLRRRSQTSWIESSIMVTLLEVGTV